MAEKLLEISELDVVRGDSLILRKINLTVEKGEVVALIGPNGAGKTTLFNSIVGVFKIAGGKIKFDGRYIHNVRQSEITKEISLVPQEGATFPFLTVLENLWVAGDRPKKNLKDDPVLDLFKPLRERLSQEAMTLSGGQRQMLALALGLMRKSKLLILDEPSLGLAPLLVKDILRTITEIRERYGQSILISEQTPQVLDVSERVYVLEGGQIRIEGKSKDLRGDDRIIKVYLGMTA
jgi:branched-chain amino acid transport system ATP-binding protein